MYVKTLLESKDRAVITATPEMPVEKAMDMLIKNNIGCLPVIDKSNNLVGVVSDKDIFRKIHETAGQYHKLQIADLMTSDPIVGIPDDELSYVAAVMTKNLIQHVPIVDGDKLIGIVSLRDIIKTTTENTEIENRYLNLYMEMMHRRDKSGD